jgi:protease-4
MLRKFLRWAVRTIAILVVLFVIAMLSDFLSHRVARGSVLVVTFKGPVVERGTPSLLGMLGPRETPLDVMRVALKRAASDPRISGLAVKILDTDLELAQAQEIAALIRKFRDSGKWAAAYVETAGEMSPGNLPYIVAAATGDASLMPEGEIDLVGVGMREIFGRGTLDWLGVRPNFGAIGKYKTFANMFTEKDFTAAQREEDESLVGGMFDQIVEAVSRERGISADQVRKLVDQAPLNADAALKSKLVQRLEYEDQFDERIKHYGGGVHQMLEFTDYARPSLLAGFGSQDQIAVIYCDGEIVRGESRGFGVTGGGVVGSDDLVGAFKKAREDTSIRAVIFRVDSPGGSVLGSELIRHAAERTAAKKPVVVSMSGYAASGGYWVSTPAARIVAEPGTITGSIGVVGGKFNISPAARKIYLNSGAISRGANVEMFDEFTDFTPAQAKFFQEEILGDSYQKFLKVVAQSRHMSVEDVDRIARGRVWTGRQADEVKLVDELGGFAEALADAKKMAKIPAAREVALVELPVQPGILERILGAQAIATAPRLPSAIRTMEPALMLIRAALSHGGTFGAAYCPVVPIL